MRRLKCSALVPVALVLCAACFACDDEAELRDPDSTAAAEQPGPGRGNGAEGGAGEGEQREQPAGGACAPTDCPAVSALGSVVPGCCQTDGSCGGLVLVMGRPLCAPPNVDSLVESAGGPLMQLREEPVVADPACTERVILGTRLPGCCDQTGVCGVSTAPVATGSPGAIPGLSLPETCVSPREAEQLGGGMAALGSEMPEPCGPASPADAGAALPGEPPPASAPVLADAGVSDGGD